MDDVKLSFARLQEVNASRAERWHPGFPKDTWSGSDWCNAMCGEAGEAANVVKKLRRIETGIKSKDDLTYNELLHMLGEELADVIIYADLLATKYDLLLGHFVTDKFNLVSKQYEFPERL